MRVLILGGTSEATRLCSFIAAREDIHATLSLAGRTKDPAPQPIPTRVGGFGGVEGLVRYLAEEQISVLIDASHPFAERISANAMAAAARADIALVVLSRAPWKQVDGDRWIEVESLFAAAAALGAASRRVLLTSGRLGLAAFEAAPQHDYLIRTVDPPAPLGLPQARIILDRGPFDEATELALMRQEKIDILVAKNSGGAATYGKIAAARRLWIPVVIVRPPTRCEVPILHDTEEVMRSLDSHRDMSGLDRGV